MEATEVPLEHTPIKSALLLYDPDYCELGLQSAISLTILVILVLAEDA
eukprot:gene8565-8747_t